MNANNSIQVEKKHKLNNLIIIIIKLSIQLNKRIS